MTGPVARLFVWPLTFLALVLNSSSSWGDERAPIRVTLWENVPANWAWDEPAGEPTERLDWTALGFVRLPAKYNARGIELDRPTPFVVRALADLQAPAGKYRLIVRGRVAARLLVDGRKLAETNPLKPNSAGHEDVPEVAPPEDPRWRYVATGDQERIAVWESDGQVHALELWALVGEKKLRPETGELSVSLVAPGGLPVLVGSEGRVPLTDEGWSAFVLSETARLDAFDTERRRRASGSEAGYWNLRHEIARREALKGAQPAPEGAGNLVDRFVGESLAATQDAIGPLVDDATFFRRLALDTTGVIPDGDEVAAFLSDQRSDKRDRAIERMLTDPRWADGWMGYWQDVLAENPGILKPTLNNTGPFRKYLHSAFLDNTPADRFATELIRMEGSTLGGGPAGFSMASQNDAPMAAKAQVLAKAFLAAEMKCARCHDAPTHPFDQADLFGLAGLLAGKEVVLPATSTVRSIEGARVPAVSVSLKAGEAVLPHWNLMEIRDESLPEALLPPEATSRDKLALLFTTPTNKRFAPVLVNRLWKRYLGIGLVEPVDDWDNSPKTVNAALLDALARELMSHEYDLKHVARLILGSRTYQSLVRPRSHVAGSEPSIAAMPARRRMSAEQVVDSMFTAVGKPFRAEELNLDPDGRRPPTEFLNLGVPRRAWQFTSTSNERDRPALSLPVVQSLVDVLESFGWRPSRQDAITERDQATNPLQPALLSNGAAANRVAGLSDDSAITALCLLDQPAESLVRAVYLRILSRPPSDAETSRGVAYLGATYAARVVPGAQAITRPMLSPARRVSWSNHLNPEATKIQLENEKAARAGDPPTTRLTPGFREKMEDIVWALINSPEFVFVP
jgi:hypothetical protein